MMKFVAISDVHIQKEGDAREELFLNFLHHPSTQKANDIYLLGDIFDLLVGGHKTYVKDFSRVFSALGDCIKKGQKIYYVEGNHDFHFKSLVDHCIEKWGISSESFVYKKDYCIKDYGHQKILFSHGDEFELENESYQKYRGLIRSPLVNFLSNTVPYFVVRNIGVKASQKSRENNEKWYGHFDNQEEVKARFRRSFESVCLTLDFNLAIFGHSHCLDQYMFRGKKYQNNGFFPSEKKFHYFDGDELSLLSLV